MIHDTTIPGATEAESQGQGRPSIIMRSCSHSDLQQGSHELAGQKQCSCGAACMYTFDWMSECTHKLAIDVIL